MTNKFKQRVIQYGIVDTRKYRYVLRENAIYRLPIAYLDTTTAIDGWELVCKL